MLFLLVFCHSWDVSGTIASKQKVFKFTHLCLVFNWSLFCWLATNVFSEYDCNLMESKVNSTRFQEAVNWFESDRNMTDMCIHTNCKMTKNVIPHSFRRIKHHSQFVYRCGHTTYTELSWSVRLSVYGRLRLCPIVVCLLPREFDALINIH